MPGCQIHTSFNKSESNKYKMTLKGSMEGGSSDARFAEKIYQRSMPLCIHLNKVHVMELLTGSPDCSYFRSRWPDVKKHCQRNHGKDFDHLQKEWTRLNDMKA